MLNMTNNGQGRVRIEFSVPARGLIGYRDEFLTDTRGSGLMHSRYDGYGPVRGSFPERYTGSIVSDRSGQAVPYALFNLEPRGQLFVQPGDQVYEGMIVGEHNRDQDIDVNPCKAKKLTNVRASGKDDQVTLTPIKPLSLELALSFIREDELLEVTPHSLRMRKLELSCQKRHTQKSREAKREKMQS
jgi:GTP-binding protein